MRSFNKNDNSGSSRRGGFGGRKSFSSGKFGGFGSFNRNDRENRQMHDTVCSNCGKDCQVPFRPTGEKPVYCSDCFDKMGGKSEKRSFGRSDYGNRSSSDDKYKSQLESVNAKLDKILSLLQSQELPAAFSEENTPEVIEEVTE